MNILFCAYLQEDKSSGVFKKIIGQIKAFENIGHNVYYFLIKNGKLFVANKNSQTELLQVKDNNFSYYLSLEKATKILVRRYKFDLLYVRRIFCTPFHLNTLKVAKKQGAVLVEELPTYPYDKEVFSSVSFKVTAIIDKIFRNFFYRYLDFISTYSKDEKIFNVKTIQINNGIDLDSIKYEKKIIDKNADVNLICVSAMCFWHGYERLIKSMHTYYSDSKNTKKVFLHFVGDGEECEKWKDMTRKLRLEDYVFFHGKLFGENLDNLFSKCEIGIGTLAGYKKDLFSASELKIREYISRGKLVVYALKDEELAEAEFALKLENDDSEIAINEIIAFRNKFSEDSEISDKIRTFAVENYRWEKQMAKVVDAYEKLVNNNNNN